MAAPSAPAPALPTVHHPEPSGHWLIRQLREQRVAIDRARLSALLSVHGLHRPGG
jgi:hypothetical protein